MNKTFHAYHNVQQLMSSTNPCLPPQCFRVG